MMMRSGNPTLRRFSALASDTVSSESAMTVQGVVHKTLLLLMLTVISATWVWRNPTNLVELALPAGIVGLVVALITFFKPTIAHITAPLYALVEGIFIGAISIVFETMYPGIVLQAVALTFGTLFCMLIAYQTGLIKASPALIRGVVAATGAVFLIYFISFVMSLFGGSMPLIHSNGPVGIIFSLVVVAIAAFNLILDFNFIEEGAEHGFPKYLEWYGAFSLMVTLIWLYIEILRLLGKLQRR